MRAMLRALIEELLSREALAELHGRASDWLEHIREMQDKHQHKQQYLNRPDTTNLMPHDVAAALTRFLNARGQYRVVTDVGQHQMWGGPADGLARRAHWPGRRRHHGLRSTGSQAWQSPTQPTPSGRSAATAVDDQPDADDHAGGP
ncbi:MAG: hypothetical protein U0Z44_07170 [Kouleothrix sp.]